MKWHARRDSRKIHRWGSIIIAVPFLVVLVTGLFLQVKKEFQWVQPPTMVGSSTELALSFDEILSITSTINEADINNWDDVERLDVRPDKGIVKVIGLNNWEVQIDTKTGSVLNVAFRRSDIIEKLHDGSWFHEIAKLWLFLPSAIIVTILWITGIYLFFVPYLQKRKNRKKFSQG